MKNIIKSLFSIAVVTAIAGSATYAYFSYSEETGMNIVEAGSLDLVLGAGDSGSLPINVGNAYPGMEASETFTVENAGTVAGYLNIALVSESVEDTENGSNEPEGEAEGDTLLTNDSTLGQDCELCDNLSVTITNLDTGELMVQNIAFASLVDLDLNNLSLEGGEVNSLQFTVKVDAEAGNEIQTDKCGANFELTLVQDVN